MLQIWFVVRVSSINQWLTCFLSCYFSGEPVVQGYQLKTFACLTTEVTQGYKDDQSRDQPLQTAGGFFKKDIEDGASTDAKSNRRVVNR